MDNIAITVSHSRYGCHTVAPEHLDAAISKYLPASAKELRNLVVERVTGSADGDSSYSDLTVSEALIILADFDRDESGGPADIVKVELDCACENPLEAVCTLVAYGCDVRVIKVTGPTGWPVVELRGTRRQVLRAMSAGGWDVQAHELVLA